MDIAEKCRISRHKLLGDDVIELADWLYRIASGMGLRSIGGNIATIYRRVKSAVDLIYEFLDHNFLGSCIKLPNGSKIPLKLGREWEWDEKVISVTEQFSGYTYSHKIRHGKVIREIFVSSIIDLRTHVVLASEVVGTASASNLKNVLDKALKRTGFREVSIRVDGASAHKQAVKLIPGKISLNVLPKKGERSQLNCIEGFHAYMDRKLRSGIHGKDPWLVKLVFIQYNFIEGKDSLGGISPVEFARGFPWIDRNDRSESIYEALLLWALKWKLSNIY